MKIIHLIVGKIILLINYLTLPKRGNRTTKQQAQLELELQKLSIYQFHACPFCVKVRRTLHKLNLPIELRNAKIAGPARDELLSQGGRIQVPCLRIDHADGTSQWMYESSAIIDYLEKKYPLV